MTPKIARSASASVDGSGTGDELLPTEFPIASTAGSALPVVMVLKLAKLMPPAPNGPLGVSEAAKANPLD